MSTKSLPRFEPFTPEAEQHPGGALAGGALAEGSEGYTVLSYELAATVLRDPRFQNSALRLMEEFGISGKVLEFRRRSVIMHDGPQQLRLRKPLARFMGPATVQNTRGVLADIVATIFGDLDDSQTVDFQVGVTRRIPSLVYCYLAGAPQLDAPKVQALSERTLSLLARDKSLVPDIIAAYDDLFEYLGDLIGSKRATGLGDDMLSYLIGLVDTGELTEQELFDEATSMLEASSVNTTHQTSLVVRELLRNRDVWQQLIADQTLIPAAIVEALRLFPRTGLLSKIATEDIELAGTTIPEGADVHVAVWSANRDPERFEAPAVFMLGRERNQPLTFSTGSHNCLGQGLAKVEMEELVRYLVEHYPNAEVVEEESAAGMVAGRWAIQSLKIALRP